MRPTFESQRRLAAACEADRREVDPPNRSRDSQVVESLPARLVGDRTAGMAGSRELGRWRPYRFAYLDRALEPVKLFECLGPGERDVRTDLLSHSVAWISPAPGPHFRRDRLRFRATCGWFVLAPEGRQRGCRPSGCGAAAVAAQLEAPTSVFARCSTCCDSDRDQRMSRGKADRELPLPSPLSHVHTP